MGGGEGGGKPAGRKVQEGRFTRACGEGGKKKKGRGGRGISDEISEMGGIKGRTQIAGPLKLSEPHAYFYVLFAYCKGSPSYDG